MAWVDTTPPASDGEEPEVVARARDPKSGELDHVLAVHRRHPAGLEAHLALYTAVMRGTASFPRVERELVAWSVSRLNDCHY